MTLVRSLSSSLIRIACAIGLFSLIAYVIAAVYYVARFLAGIETPDPVFLSIAIIIFILALALGGIAWFLRAWHCVVEEKKPKPTIPLQPMDKPPGFNKEVLKWFHHGPEGRVVDDEFKAGFAARSQVPPPKAKL